MRVIGFVQFASMRNIKDVKRVIEEVCSAIGRFYEFAKLCHVDIYVADKIEKCLVKHLPGEYATTMRNHLGTSFPSYVTNEGLR